MRDGTEQTNKYTWNETVCLSFCTKFCFVLSLVVFKGMMCYVGNMTSFYYYFTHSSKVVALERWVTLSVVNFIEIIIVKNCKLVCDVNGFACSSLCLLELFGVHSVMDLRDVGKQPYNR